MSCFIYIENPKYPCRPWIRVTTPYAGKGKGMHILPEIGEEVMVGFENGNAEKPIVMGTMFHGQGKSGHGGAGNFMKGLQTASGNKLQMNDKDGSVKMTDKGGASMKMDGAGNVNHNSAASHAVNVGGKKGSPQSLIKADSAGNITIDGKTSITLKVGGNEIVINGSGITGTVAIGNISFDATTGKFTIHSATEMSVTTDTALTINSKTATISSSGATTIKGADVEINKG